MTVSPPAEAVETKPLPVASGSRCLRPRARCVSGKSGVALRFPPQSKMACDYSVVFAWTSRYLDCAGRAQRRRRFGSGEVREGFSRSRAGKSGGGPPPAKTLARSSVGRVNAPRLGVLQSAGALFAHRHFIAPKKSVQQCAGCGGVAADRRISQKVFERRATKPPPPAQNRRPRQTM